MAGAGVAGAIVAGAGVKKAGSDGSKTSGAVGAGAIVVPNDVVAHGVECGVVANPSHGSPATGGPGVHGSMAGMHGAGLPLSHGPSAGVRVGIGGGSVQPSGSGGVAHVSPGAKVGSKKIGGDGAESTGAGIAGAGFSGIIGVSGVEAASIQMACDIIASKESVEGIKKSMEAVPLQKFNQL